MTACEFDDVVLVPFPFTDQRTTKRRPAVSSAHHRRRRDILIMAITSQQRPGALGEAAVRHWQQAGLLKPSGLKPLIATIEAELVLRKLGRLHPDDQQILRQLLAAILG